MITLTHRSGISITLHPFGASWTSCQIPLNGERREILLGCRQADLSKQSVYLGATVGRYANRIADAAFSLMGTRYALSANQNDKHTLHGGADNFAYRRWQIVAQNDTSVTFALNSPDGDQGFAGNLSVTVTYTVGDNTVSVEYQAHCDRLSVCSLTNHAYFNLDGVESGTQSLTPDARHQRLTIPAKYFLPVDSEGIPNAELTHVTDTPFDFTSAMPIAEKFADVCRLHDVGGYDHSFYFAKNGQEKTVAVLQSADQRLTMRLSITQSALHFYSGNGLVGTPNRHGGEYNNFAGIALEAGCLPNSPNHPDHLSECLIFPNETLRQKMIYIFDY